MYSKGSNLKNINIISKFIGLLFTLSSIFITNNCYVFIICSIIFILINKDRKLSFILFILTLINYFIDISVIVKLLFVLTYLDMFINVITFNEVRYFLEELFYKRNNKTLYFFLYIIYFIKNMKNNIKKLIDLNKSYGLKFDLDTYKFIIKQGYLKSKLETSKIMMIYKYRFYNLTNKKTYYEKDEIDSYDFKYILVYVIIFLLIYIYGR